MNHSAGTSIRGYLLAFGAALLAPVLIAECVLLWQTAASERSRYERDAQAAALRVSAAIDRELATTQAAAQTLASSAALHAGNYARFHERAQEVLKTWRRAEDFAIVVRDTSGQQVVNTRLPFGAPLPRGVAEGIDREVIASKQAVFQGVFIGATAGRPIVSIRVPVYKGDDVTHVLSAAVEPRYLADLLKDESLPPPWAITLVDRAGRIIARSVEHDRFVGQEAPKPFRDRIEKGEGVWTGTNMNGESVFAAFTRSPFSGWTAAVSIPQSVLEQPLRRFLLIVSAFGALLLVVFFMLAAWFGKRIADPIRSLSVAAHALGQGKPVSLLTTGLREVDRVGEAMAAASAGLRVADERQKLLMNELNHRVKNTLATVQSLAWQTLRRGVPPEVARERFEARLLSLSKTHNLLNQTGWDGASIIDILKIELEPYRGDGGPRFTLSGPDLMLPARTAVVLGMAVHEITTNAAKHGALSVPDGHVAVAWENPPGRLNLDWRETGGPIVVKTTRQGFGSRLIRQTIEQELAGEVNLRFDPDGLRCAIRISLSETPQALHAATAA